MVILKSSASNPSPSGSLIFASDERILILCNFSMLLLALLLM